MYDLARIRYVTEHYRDLQGLTLLPYSLWLLAWAGYDLGWVRPNGWLSHEWLFVGACFAIMIALMLAIGKLYELAFGWISAEPRTERETSTWEIAAYLVPTMLASELSRAQPEVSRFGLHIAITVLWLWRRRDDRKLHLPLAILLAAISFAPLFDANLYPSATARDVAIKVVAAVGILAIGTFNHLLLVRTLGPVRREEQSRA